ncbi:MAG: signal recognition particle-docking protein FtsY [Bradymonadia bacterium]
METVVDAGVAAPTTESAAVETPTDAQGASGPLSTVEYVFIGLAAVLVLFLIFKGISSKGPAKALAGGTSEGDNDATKREPPKRSGGQTSKPEKTPEPAKAPAEAPVEAAGKTLKEGLTRTREGFVGKLGKLFSRAKTLDDDLLGDIEEALFTADIGVKTSQRLVEIVHEELKGNALQDPQAVWSTLKGKIAEILKVDATPVDLDAAKPFVIMVVGVNGAGKTTSIGKLARRFSDEGRSVMLAAGDTFRAAAVEQLQAWGERANVPVIRGEDGQDPASVAFDACKQANEAGADVLIVDTAGRLQAKKALMDELGKVHRVMNKAIPGAPHEVWLVLDSTNGQNAISQAREFTSVVDVTGIVLTKLDGTAKGGVVIGITDEMNLPVRYIGIGEKAEDLRPFDAAAFTEALLSED